MTNNAPERIGLLPDGLGLWALASREEATGAVRYIRADIAQAEKDAAVAAEREACAVRLESLKDTAYQNSLLSEGVTYSCAIAAIRARGNTDTLAERDALVRNEALREAATICNRTYGGSIGDVHKAILALITDTDEGTGDG
jgi:hypothetical protein